MEPLAHVKRLGEGDLKNALEGYDRTDCTKA